jgi:hypothetical protein
MENGIQRRTLNSIRIRAPLRKIDAGCNVAVEWLRNQYHQLRPTP